MFLSLGTSTNNAGPIKTNKHIQIIIYHITFARYITTKPLKKKTQISISEIASNTKSRAEQSKNK